MSRTLREEQLESWKRDGYLHIPGFFDASQVADLVAWTQELAEWPETPGKWMKYFERGQEAERQLCRVENFIPFHEGFRQLLCGEDMTQLVSALMGEPAILYKEKINFKLPGGAGFGAHQDAPAFTTFGQTFHITMMVSVDASTPENGCLEMVPAQHLQGLFAQNPDGTLSPEVVSGLSWIPVPTQPGDVLFFDSYVPHRSNANRSEVSRRALYITYNKAAEGNRREDYFQHKREHFPPPAERIPGKDYSQAERLYNLGNPIR